MIDEVETYVRERRSMVVATCVDGEIRASTACFALGEGLTIYFFVFRNNVKHQGISQNPQVSLVIDDGFTVPMRGVEIIGTAKIASGSERQRGQELLTERFPDLGNVWDDPRILVVRVTPDRVRFTDWGHEVGHSSEASLVRGGAAERGRVSG